MSNLVYILLTLSYTITPSAPNTVESDENQTRISEVGNIGQQNNGHHYSHGHQRHVDVRCKCVCPNPSIVNATHTERKLYIKNVPPMLCDCPNVVITSLYETLSLDPAHKIQLPQAFCPRCVCKYEQRNTAVIKFVVMMVMSVIGLLGLYLVFLVVEPKLRHRFHLNYSIQVEEEQMSLRQYDDSCSSNGGNGGVGGGNMGSAGGGDFDDEDHLHHLPDVAVTTNSTMMRSRDWGSGSGNGANGGSLRPGTLLDQVTIKQDRWKHQVAVQRRNIYEDRSILN